MKQTSRRDFLKLSTNSLLALAGTLGFGGLIRYLGYQFDEPPQTEFEVGSVNDYPYNSRTVLAHIPAIIIHDNDGLRAISLECTHLGCTTELRNFGFECPCHGSQFDMNGKTLKGPAVSPLNKLRVEQMADGTLRLFTI
jgi:cytochrome b6-f complex iron-sulfur subunit